MFTKSKNTLQCNVRFKLGELRSGGILLETIRIGSGAGYAGDRIEPALDLIEYGNIDYIVFECLAERTIALAQLQKLKGSTNCHCFWQ